MSKQVVHLALLKGHRHRLLTLLHWGLSNCLRERAFQTVWSSPYSQKF
jgi:hypothetical protein